MRRISHVVFALALLGTALESAYAADDLTAQNVEFAKTYVKAVRIATVGSKDPAKDLLPLAEKYIAENYVEHSWEMDQPGRAGFVQMMLKRAMAQRSRSPSGATPASSGSTSPPGGAAPPPSAGPILERVLSFKEHYMGDGEYVVWTTEIPGADPNKPTVNFNMLRIVNGKVAEHWASNK